MTSSKFSGFDVISCSTMGRMINDFIGMIGPGQIAGRDTVTTRSLGQILLGVVDRGGRLEVRVGRVKNLFLRSNTRNLPGENEVSNNYLNLF